jgi:hypothetical protein
MEPYRASSAITGNPTTGDNFSNSPASQFVGINKFFEPQDQPNFGSKVTGRSFDSYGQEIDQTQVITQVIGVFNSHQSVVLQRCLPLVLVKNMVWKIRTLAITPGFARPTPEEGAMRNITTSEEVRRTTTQRYGLGYEGTLDSLNSYQGGVDKLLKERGIMSQFYNLAVYQALYAILQINPLSKLNEMRFGMPNLKFFDNAQKDINDFAMFSIHGMEGLRSAASRASQFIQQEVGMVPDTALIPAGSSFAINGIESKRTYTFHLQSGPQGLEEAKVMDSIDSLGNLLTNMAVFEAVPLNVFKTFAGHDPTISETIVTQHVFQQSIDLKQSKKMYNFRSEKMNVRVFDYNKNAFVEITFLDSMKHAHLFKEDGSYCNHLYEWYNRNKTNPSALMEHFLIAENPTGGPSLINILGQMQPRYVGDGFRMTAQSILGKLFVSEIEMASFARKIESGITLRSRIRNQKPTREYLESLENTPSTTYPPDQWSYAEQSAYGSVPLPPKPSGMLYPTGFHGVNGIFEIAYSEHDWGQTLRADATAFAEGLDMLAKHLKKFIPQSRSMNSKNIPNFVKETSQSESYGLIGSIWQWDYAYFAAGSGPNFNNQFEGLLGESTKKMWDKLDLNEKSKLSNRLNEYASSQAINETTKKTMVRNMVTYATSLMKQSHSRKKKSLPDFDDENAWNEFVESSSTLGVTEENPYIGANAPRNGYVIAISQSPTIDRVILESGLNWKWFNGSSWFEINPSNAGSVQINSELEESSNDLDIESQFTMDADIEPAKSKTKYTLFEANESSYSFGAEPQQRATYGQIQPDSSWRSYMENEKRVSNNPDLLERIVSRAVMNTPANGITWENLAKQGAFPLFKFILWNPMVFVKTSPFAAMIGGEFTGFLAYMKPTATFGTNSRTQTYNGSLSMRLVPVIQKDQNIFVLRDFFIRGVRGWGTGFIESADELLKHANGQGDPTKGLIATAVPWNCEQKYPGMSICGTFVAGAEMRDVPSEATYPTAGYYSHVYAFERFCKPKEGSMHPHQADGIMTGYSAEMTHMKFTDRLGGNKGTYAKYIGSGHLARLTFINNKPVMQGVATVPPPNQIEWPVYDE